ncbi:hypothetical protein M514_24722 [Trichuris suis]|uniref:Uncharacterized protein n=1 Tax=Trichuris suis TaxID=68888 RepID=A0A085N0Y9_9BILA|nr:hypothetical protein M514_24722 [Trichuris suis]
MNASAKKRCRQYSVEYLSYSFIAAALHATMPFCLNCMKMFSNENVRPSRFKKRLYISRLDRKDKPQVLRTPSKQFRKKVHSTERCELFILPSGSITISAVMDLNGRETYQSIPLGDSTISRRMYEMAEDIEGPFGQLNPNQEIPSAARRNYFAR